MKVAFLCKDDASGDGGCPSAYLREDGMVVIQAPEVDPDTLGNLLDVLPGERAVYMNPAVILRAAEMIVTPGS